MDGLEIEILTLGGKRPRNPSVNDPPDPEEDERQYQIDEPSTKKKQRAARKQKRSLPVDELITTSESLGSHHSTDGMQLLEQVLSVCAYKICRQSRRTRR